MKKTVCLLLSLAFPIVASAQVQLISGFNFGQYVGGGVPSTDGTTGDPIGFIQSNFGPNSAPGPEDSGVFKANNSIATPYSAGSSTLYYDGTHSSSAFSYTLGTDVSVLERGALVAINEQTVNPLIQMFPGDDNNAGLRFTTSVGGPNQFSIVTNTTGWTDFDPLAFSQPNDFNFTFAAYALTGTGSVQFSLNGLNIGGLFSVAGGEYQAFNLDLPESFYGQAAVTLVATVTGDLAFDHVQLNGFFGTPPASFLLFWKDGSGIWTVANTPTNWRSEDGTEEGVWDPAGATATFRGTPGTVAVDNTGGAVTITGLKFLVNGYAIAGDAITTTTPATVFQVGDGTPGSSEVIATISAPITGTGGIDKTDLGALVLSGANTYSGATAVSAGTLTINGNQSAATGAVTVASGATLGGTGTLGGAVTVHEGGTLTGKSGSTLTMAGLTLRPTANLNVALGAPGMMELFQVNGDLTLDGLLNVSSTAGFGGGLYRLIDFTGSLTDNGMALGAVPGSLSDFTVQTSVPNQVNLLVDVSSIFWGGGSGTWSTGGDGWQLAGGGATTWSPSFAIFQSPSGTVTVDDSGGPVVFEGVQFAATGYTVTGDALTTNTTGTTVRVGDGTGTGAAMTATISAPIAGTGSIDKRDLGTLILSGANTYSGGTTVSEGTLQIGGGGTTGSVVGNITNNATLTFNRSDAFNFDGIIGGTGAVVKQGSGVTTLTGANLYSGGTTVSAGTLQGSATSLQGAIVNNASVVFDQAAAGNYAGAISGTGALTKQGTGTLSLTGANTFSGGTTVTAGTLQIGNGGTTGSLAGSITNNATVAFDRSNDYTHSEILSGVGAVVKQGSGTTTLTGANSYTGATSVNAGKLLINGNQSAATGAITVASGGTLGGTGTTGGVVTVEDGGTLSGQTGSTFTMAGLVLNQSSILSVGLGAPGTTPLFNVNISGDLTLDGILNISGMPGFGEGLYRLFNYNGALTNNTLDIGTVAGNPAAYTVQTTTANSVNLLYSPSTAPLSWAGGSGTWSSDPSGTGWGPLNSTWNAGFALFDGTPGTVTIASTSTDPVVVTGVQFAVDGYVVTGTTLTTNTANTPFRVGDGTSAGANMTATISAPIDGSGGVDKTDLGTLVLTGANTYTGGTRVSAGVLQISDDAALGADTGSLTLDSGTLRAGADFTLLRSLTVTDAGGTIDTAANIVSVIDEISGSGPLSKRGTGVLTISNDNPDFAGTTTIAEGTL
ncbi:MAG TPA: autotransporter-associated beta strand repeat-containing protein, partial [Opitutaceae bacterium]|nr:autotransporter-associated beta strand repeat-containing protein [Opitutaceae bacterium]